MTARNSLSTSLSARSSASSVDFVTLEQTGLPDSASHLDMRVLYRMWLRALDGHSAQLYRPPGCPVAFQDGKVVIWFDFYCWPSAMDLRFELGASIGTIGPAEIVELPRERDIIIPLASVYELDFLALQAALAWQTGCYDQAGNQLPVQPLQLTGNSIRFDQELFGVARLAATAWGHKYRLTVTLDKGDNRISLDAPVITAAWRDAAGDTVTTQLSLTVPECVQTALALCDGEHGSVCANTPADDEGGQPVTVYYSTCDGSILDIRYGEDQEGYCR